MPLSLRNGPKPQRGDDLLKEFAQKVRVAERLGTAPMCVDHPFDSIHIFLQAERRLSRITLPPESPSSYGRTPLAPVFRPAFYGCACPHSGQNLLTFGIALPQLRQNFVAALVAAAGAAPLAGAALESAAPDPAFLSASIIA